MKWSDFTELKMNLGAKELKMLAIGNSPKINCNSAIPTHERTFYKYLTINELQSLRCSLYQNHPDELSTLEPWFEAVLRFCEVNMWRLEKRMSELWGSDKASYATTLTSAFLLEIYLAKEDLRFFNAVLKIQRSRIFPNQQLLKNTKSAIFHEFHQTF